MLFFASILSAALLWAAFPPVNLWPLAWFALVPLFWALDRASSKGQVFGLAYSAGLLFFLLAIFWIHHVTFLGLILLSSYLAVYFGLFGLFYYYVRSAFRFTSACLLLPAAWIILEYVRSVAFTGFGWAGLGHSQALFGGLIQMAGVTGVEGVSFLVVAANFLMKELFSGLRTRSVWRLFGLLLFILVLASFNSLRLAKHPVTLGIKVAVIQPNVSLSEAWDPLLKDIIIDRLIGLSREALPQKPQLIIWPESSFPGFTWERPDLLAKVKAFAKENEVYILFGAVTRQKDRYFNSAVLVGRSGEILAQKSKRHLVLFGEYLPFRQQFPFLQDIVPIDDFTPGAEEAIFDAPGLGKFGVLICFEDTIPALARDYVRQGAGFLVNMTNDAWFRNSGQPAMHLYNALFRAVENRRPLIRATNTGESCVISSDGLPTGCVKDNQGHRVQIAGFVVTSVYPEVRMNWYTKCGASFVLLCLLILAASLLARLRKKKVCTVMGRKILIIDDDRGMHAMLKAIFSAHGYEVVSAMNGEDGLKLAESENPALIILDVIMPKLKGREVCKRLKSSQTTAQIPVLFLTAKDSDDDVKAEIALGAVGHITKPINSALLLRLIKKTLSL